MSDIWGPHLWHLLHTISFNTNEIYTCVEKKMLLSFYNDISNMLPCIFCKSNYKKHIKQYPINNQLSGSKSLCNWVIHMHNLVNEMNGKQSLTYNEVYPIHIKPSKESICYIINYLAILSFNDKRPFVLLQYLNFLKYLIYIFPTQKGKDIIGYFFKNYPINERYKNVIYFKDWFYNLHKILYREGF